MDNTMMVYLNKRLHQNNTDYQSAKTLPGPVICISREVGCGGVNIARQLANELDKQCVGKKWKVLSKEILLESARELDMEPNKLRNYLNEGDRGLFDDVLSAFSEKRYKSDKKISKTLIDLITSFASDGYCIIVGRAGHIISREIEKSLLVKLTAPLDWRIKQIMEKNNLDRREVIEFIEKTEKERENFRKHIAGDRAKIEEFDLILNLSRMKIADVISLICFTSLVKGILQTNKSKAEAL